MSLYRARYNNRGEKVYEEENGVVLFDICDKATDAGYYVMDDIQPYKPMGEDVAGQTVINSRSQHRSYLKRNGYIELGNEPMVERKPDAYNSEEVKREIAKHLYR
jgi:hypothetical protein